MMPDRSAGIEQPLVAELLRVRILEAPLTSVVPMSFSSLRARRVCLVEVHADGAVGVGESWINYPDWVVSERIATLSEGVAGVLLGSDVRDPSASLRRLSAALLPLGRQWGAPGPIWQAISGVELALWDLAGKVTSRAVAELLANGTPRSTVPAYASGVGPTDVEVLCERALSLGLGAIKVKLGFGYETDAETLRTARDVCGDDIRLLADANQAWDLATAIDMSTVLKAHRVEWIEEPLAGNAVADLEEFAERTGLPVATGENVYGLDAFAEYVQSPAVRQVQPDVSKTGGLAVAAAVADFAAEAGVGVSPHCYGGALCLAASVHLGGAFDQVDWVELDVRDNPLRSDLLSSPLVVRDGVVQVPTHAGLAGELDPDVVRQYQVYQADRKRP